MANKVQKIREEVVRLKSQLLRGACSSQVAMETRCKEEAYNEVLAILDTMQDEPVSEDLDSFATKYAQDKPYPVTVCQAVRVGANWQKQQDNNDANHALIEQIKTQQMCYEKGMADMKQQLMAKAVDGEVTYGKSLAIPSLGYRLDKEGLDFGDKVKLIIIKED